MQITIAGLPEGAVSAETMQKKILKNIVAEIKSANMDGLNPFDLDIDAGLDVAVEMTAGA
ncbi:hypothetical protein WCX18_04830 [Sulfurimonas sp. HSL1-2]|uniref:hypothetical protein n=1 Tax=Thiomicrolovo zhangzhouensis TaxID=3131933 RepID=UPI0031F7F985